MNPEHFHNASYSNPDGAGIAYFNGRKTVILKSPRWRGEQIEREMEKLKDAPAIVHFRFATHGRVNYDNAHPFALSKGYAAAHNGVICTKHLGKPKHDESDTRQFLRVRVNRVLTMAGCIGELDLLEWGEEIGTGNKLAIMSNRGDVSLVNDAQGHWFEDCWFSNYSYEAYKVPKFKHRISSSYVPDIIAGMKWTVKQPCTACDEFASTDRELWLDSFTPLCDDCGEYFATMEPKLQ
jgi:predicted glutamine amidotransferase